MFVTLGLLVGNRALDLFGVGADTPAIRHLAEATLTLVLFCDAIRVNRGRLRRESGVPARLLGRGQVAASRLSAMTVATSGWAR